MTTYCKTRAQADAEILEWLNDAPGRSFPNNYRNQCTALVQHFCATLLGRPWTETLGFGDAVDHIANASTAYFEKVWNDPNDANQLPRVGDIASYWGAAPLWDGRYYGHTGVVLRPDRTTQTLVQQDGAKPPLMKGPGEYSYSVHPAFTQTFAYVGDPAVGNMRGWLRMRPEKVVYTGADKRLGVAASNAAPPKAPARPRDGIDVAVYQPPGIAAMVRAEFVIVKATEGTGYVNPNLAAQVAAARKRGALVGLYHFADVGASSDAEADHFARTVAPHLDAHTALFLDWENADDPPAGQEWKRTRTSYVAWAEDFMRRADRTTGRTLGLYCTLAVSALDGWTSRASRPLWLAWYGSSGVFNGYADSFTPPKPVGWKLAVWQYTGNGRLPGYGGALDLDAYFGGVTVWDRKITTNDGKDWFDMSSRDDLKAAVREVLREPIKKEGGKKGTTSLIREAAWADANFARLRDLIEKVPAAWAHYRIARAGKVGGEVTPGAVAAWDYANWRTVGALAARVEKIAQDVARLAADRDVQKEADNER